ncbi:MAG: hypothetical protein ACI977_000252 [Candidatus Nanohaloarchaea archaeon]|jgi:hypothetical protein
MAQEMWAEVLESIYENEEYWKMQRSQLDEVSEDLGITEEEMDQVLGGLESQSLIERDIEDVKLTQRGFEFISEKKTHEEQLITQRLLLVFVTALSLATLVDTFIKIGNQGSMALNVVYSVVFAIVFIVLGMIAKQNL